MTIFEIVKQNNINRLEEYIKSGCNINIQNNYGDTLLHIASERGYTEIVKLLLKYKADVNIRNKWNETVLDIAKDKINYYTEIIELLE
jgi:ankyrin repeat protein